MLNSFGWIDGITSSFVVIFGIIFGSFFIYRARKLKAKLLIYLGADSIFAGLMFFGVFLDFLSVLIVGQNLPNVLGLVGLLSYIWYAPTIIVSIYIGVELLLEKNNWLILLIFIILSIIFEVLIFLYPLESFNFIYPENTESPEILIDYNINLFSVAGILMAILLFSLLFFLGFGFLRRAVQTSGIMRKKFLLLSLGSFSFCIFGLFEGVTVPGIAIIFIRIGYLSSFWLFYFGLIRG
ncbi:MAG: hypothetical protein ACTSXH_18330 [Promethearchaeota archaeon]